MGVSKIPNQNGLRIKYVTIPVTAKVSPNSNVTLLNWGDVGGSYFPGKTIESAFLAFASGSVLYQVNCQIRNGSEVLLSVYNPTSAAINVTNIILAVFYHD